MKILFIFKMENFLAPLGPMVISAMAKQQGHTTYLCEMNSSDPLERIRQINPEVVAYSSSTGESKHYLSLNNRIKESFPHIFTIMGGPHVTFYPQVVKESSLDAICLGEGEYAFSDYLDSISSRRTTESIPNIMTKFSDSYELRDLIQDLDSLPFPDYGLMYDNTPMGNSPLKSFIVSRGCPYQCTYCFNPTWRKIYEGKGKTIRRHSVDYVIDSIRKVREKWPLSTVKFYDDIFCHRADSWLEEFSRKYKSEIGIPFFILTRADLLNEDIVKLLKTAGCRTISMSIEAGNPQIRNNMLKRNMSDEQIIAAHKLCDKYGINTFTNCIIGLPETKISQDLESIDLAIKCRATWAEFLIFYPYPGTQLGDYTLAKGLYKADYHKMHTSYMFASELNCFNQREKNAQRNIAELGAVAVVMPGLRYFITKHLIYWPHNRFFIFLYWLVKMYVIRSKIYVTRTNLIESLKIYIRSLRQEMFRHMQEKVT